MNGYSMIPPGYSGFNQGYMNAQQYMAQPLQNQSMMTQSQLQQQKQSQMSYLCVPVSSREEAIGVRAEALSMGTLMPDLAHGFIYFKRLNQSTGTSEFYEFGDVTPKEIPPVQIQQQQEENSNKYVVQEDFTKLCSAFVQLQKEFKAIKNMVEADESE